MRGVYSRDQCRGRRKSRGREIRSKTIVLQKYNGQYVPDKTNSSGSDPFLHPRLVQLSQKAIDSVEMRSTKSEWLFRRLEGKLDFPQCEGGGGERYRAHS